MWLHVREVARGALADFSASWRKLVALDLLAKLVSFAILTPITALVLQWLLSRSGSAVVADADIARFFLTTRPGLFALLAGSTVTVAITALEVACLMAIGRGLNVRDALVFGVQRAPSILRLAGHMVLRVILGLIPFVVAIGAVYLLLLRGHDINYFLSRRPPEFIVAAALATVILIALLWLLLRTVARWALAVPLVVFEGVHPRRALGESAARSSGNAGLIVSVLTAWAIVAIGLGAIASVLINVLARVVAPKLAGSLPALIVFLAVLAIVWAVVSLAVAAINISLFALLLLRIWQRLRQEAEGALPKTVSEERERIRLGRRMRLVFASTAILFAVGVALLAFLSTRRNEPVLVLAHRGSSVTAPENTLAAFRQAIADGADFVELDVQESSDGEVLVVHDSDLMKIGGSPMKIWEHTAAELRAIDIGSHRDARFNSERVPTLAEALAVCKGRVKVLVELKSYGHGKNLEEKVAAIVESAGMVNDTAFMSLDHSIVRRMKTVRPSWRVGALVAKAVGDPTAIGADFLGVESKMATARFVRRAHRAKQDVYVWTVNDPAWMLTMLSRGVDGIITDQPALAREAVSRRSRMSNAQRFLLALLLRAGARPESLQSSGALRP